MSGPVRYELVSEYERVPRGSACEGCGAQAILSLDHCHDHGWARGIACFGCNQYLGIIDRRLTPRVSDAHLAALLGMRNRCPDCLPLTAADLERPGRRARENRLQKMAGELRCELMIARRGSHATDPGTYALILPEGRFEVFASSDSALEFLARLPLAA